MTKEEALQFQSLEDILRNASLTPLFQPIVSHKKNKIYGYEALIRGPSDSPLHSPINLFDTASRHGQLAELDLLCREVAIKEFGRLNLDAKLFINTIPAALLQSDYPHGLTLKFLKQAKLSPTQVVIELTEQYPIDDYSLMRDATEHYRDMGLTIAIDDLGAGYSGLRTWSEIKPDFVKLDRHFIQDIHSDKQKRQFVQSMVDIAKSIKCKVIAEGIEVREEYLAIQEMGVEFGQGYYFARPRRQPQLQLDSTLFAKRIKTSLIPTKPRANSLVSSLLTPLKPLNNSDKVSDVGDRFQLQSNLIALPVINHKNHVIGIVWRDEFMTLYASRYGRDLHGRKPIQLFMDHHPIVADSDLSLKQLSQLMTSQENDQQHSIFIITEHDHYRGIGSLMDLLRQITDLQITTARHANPLSGLPGNVPISEHITDALHDKRDAVMCYFDLDNFKPYNDIYGFGKGDKVISKTAKILLDKIDPDYDFVGHVGGDDFIILFESEDWQQRCHAILDAFTSLHPELYNDQDIENGGITALDRYGNSTFYPLLCLSIGAVRLLDFDKIRTEADLTEHASKAKSMAKKQTGNSLYVLS
ncbi:MAG: bifunctional diguanylate cyclase/phosphodiesterase [Gammaproteobacteria bacterium]|nr:bifunctional diguanylate cyclase/phosphodiesterase [Gammaproteobacteria bacterium]